jgi:hypothetical protein
MACAFGIAETVHFGNNLFPQSDAEWICDGITLVLFALSIRGKLDKVTP